MTPGRGVRRLSARVDPDGVHVVLGFMNATPKTAALYLRVSTTEQSTENQLPDLEQLAAARGLKIVAVYSENVSAVKQRPEFEKMMRDAHRGRFGTLVIWSLDRLGRTMSGNMQAVLDLDRRGVQVVSVREPWLTMDGPVRALLVAVFSWVAEQERLQIAARVRAGIDRARRRGVRLGRPIVRLDVDRALELRGQGMSYAAVAAELGVSVGKLHGALRDLRKSSSPEGSDEA